MLSIAAAFPKPHAGPSWTTSRTNSSIVSALRTDIILCPFLDFGKSRNERISKIVLPRVIELAMRQKNLTQLRETVVGAARGHWMSTPEPPSHTGLLLRAFRGQFDPLMGAVFPPAILSQIPTGT
jgi:hypothetical protein